MTSVTAGAVLYVGDLDRMRAFYAAVVGLVPTEGDDTYVALERDGFQLVLLATPSAAAHADDEVRADVPVKLVHVVPDLDAALAAVLRAGGRSKGGEWAFGEDRAQDAVDPEGNVLQLRGTT